jgi:hypothetical protein
MHGLLQAPCRAINPDCMSASRCQCARPADEFTPCCVARLRHRHARDCVRDTAAQHD